jgi:hypothetical protein
MAEFINLHDNDFDNKMLTDEQFEIIQKILILLYIMNVIKIILNIN